MKHCVFRGGRKYRFSWFKRCGENTSCYFNRHSSRKKKRYGTYFIKCHDLIQQLKKAKLENRLEARLRHFFKYKLLIIDELGYLPIEKNDANLFFQLIDLRYEKRSTILTTNINFNSWDDVFYDPVIANAILDRILHHAHVINITGKSYRLREYMIQDDE